MNHDIRVELVKAVPERYRNKEGPFQLMFRVIKIGYIERKVVSCLSAELVSQDAEKRFEETLRGAKSFLRGAQIF